jgi:hypothetical protein
MGTQRRHGIRHRRERENPAVENDIASIQHIEWLAMTELPHQQAYGVMLMHCAVSTTAGWGRPRQDRGNGELQHDIVPAVVTLSSPSETSVRNGVILL